MPTALPAKVQLAEHPTLAALDVDLLDEVAAESTLFMSPVSSPSGHSRRALVGTIAETPQILLRGAEFYRSAESGADSDTSWDHDRKADLGMMQELAAMRSAVATRLMTRRLLV